MVSCYLSDIIKITKRGTLKNIPTRPHIFPINDKKIIKAIGLMFKVLPISFVSKKFPINICETSNKIKVSIGVKNSINWMVANKEGNTTARSDPM